MVHSLLKQDIVALGNFIENEINLGEDQLFFIGGARKLLTAYSKVFTNYEQKFNVNSSELRQKMIEKMTLEV